MKKKMFQIGPGIVDERFMQTFDCSNKTKKKSNNCIFQGKIYCDSRNEDFI